MHTESGNSGNSIRFTANVRRSRKFLIPRPKRRIFFFRFILMTLLGWVVGGIASIALKKFFVDLLPAVVNLPQPVLYIWGDYISNLLFALIFGVDQALVVRQYISGRRWMITTTLGWLVASNVSAIWIQYIYFQAVSLNQTLSAQQTLLFGFLSTLVYILSGIWMGFFQWLVLRRYATSAWKWIFVPAISFFFISVFMFLLAQARVFIPQLNQNIVRYFSEQILTALMLGIVPSVFLCAFKFRPKPKQKSQVTSQDSSGQTAPPARRSKESGVRSQE